MVYEFNGSACDGYTVTFRFVTRIDTGDTTRLTDQQTTTFEDSEGKSFSFVTKSFVDQNLDKEIRGTATRDDKGVKIDLEKPKQQSIDIASTQFPTQHLVDLLNKADTGDTFYETSLFDGSEDANRALTTTVIIGKQGEGNNGDPEAPALASLDKDKFWPVDIAYFDETKNGGEELPEYRISFKLHKNGLTRDLLMDYGEFSMTGKLVNLKLFDVKPRDLQIGRSAPGRVGGGERVGAWRLPHRFDRERGLSFVDSFVAPRPNMKLIRVMTAINRVFMLKGMPLLRDLPPFSKVPPFRGIANIRHLDFPAEDQARLAAVCGAGKATFIAPNHPEFFTDWMIDKEIIARVSPLAAAWATHGVVNGLGRLAQQFWLANNLIAQIPGNSAPARAHSVAWALEGHGVLLHPEGAVGWHNNHVAALMPGAVEMGLEALETGRRTNPGFQAWVAPVVWKLAFTSDVEKPLLAECAYVEGRLKIGAGGSRLPLAERVYRIYALLLAREEDRLGLTADPQARFAERQAAVIAALSLELQRVLDAGTVGRSWRIAAACAPQASRQEGRSARMPPRR